MKKITIPLLNIVLIILIALQVYAAYSLIDTRSYAYDGIKYAVRVYEGGSFSLNAIVMSMLGIVCRLISMHPLVFVNTIALVMIPLSYLAYNYLFNKISTEDSKDIKALALIMLCIINYYGYYSGNLSGCCLLTGYFTGYSICLNVIAPIGAGILAARLKPLRDKEIDESFKQIKKIDNYEESDEDLEEWDMKKHPIVNARNLAIALGIVVVIMLASVFVLNSKINSLYDATVNLQNQLNEYTNGDN